LNSTLNALQQLTAEAQVIQQRVRPVNGERACLQLSGALHKLREKRMVIKLDRPKLSVEATWSRFAAARYDLSALDGLQFRTLCCAEETALRPEFVGALAKHPEMLKRSRCLYGMVNSYFVEWRTAKNPSALEALLVSVLLGHGGTNPVVQKWLVSKALFSERAAEFLAERVCLDPKGVDEVLREHYVGPLTKLGLCARASAARLSCECLRRMEGSRDNEWSLRYLQWMTEKVLSDLTFPDAFTDAVSSLILSDSAKRSESFQHALRSYIQNHKRLGDPRIRESSPNWRSIAPAAVQRYLSWLARDNIVFFFDTILPNNSVNRRRKDFWLRYHDRIKDFQVALSDADVWKVKAGRQSTDILYYSRVVHPTTSAFLMKFEGYPGGGPFLVIEFSEKGNAAYIYNLADFESRGLTLRTNRFELKNHLKFNTTHRIFHTADWESSADYRLSSEFGITP